MNSVVLIGRLTRDPELRFIPGSGTAVSKFTLAVDRPFTNNQGQREADFLRIIVWGRQAENCANHLGKGRLVAVHGRIQTSTYEKDGTKHYITEIVADRVKFLDYKKNNNNNDINNDDFDDFYEGFEPVDDDEIPF